MHGILLFPSCCFCYYCNSWVIWKKCDLRVTKHERGSFQFGIWKYLWHVLRKFYHCLILSMYIVINRVRKTFDETLGITGTSRSWDLSNLFNAPCPPTIPVGRGLWQRLTCTLTWAVVTPDSGHCLKGTCGVMEQQDPEVPQCPSTTDPWRVPLDTAELPLGLPWDLCFIPSPSLLVAEPWCNHLPGELPEEMGFTGKLWLHGKERVWVTLWAWFYLSASCTGTWLVQNVHTGNVLVYTQAMGSSLPHAQVCAPGTLQAFCHPEGISAKYQGWLLHWNAEFWLCTSFGLAMLLSLVTLSFNVDIHLPRVWTCLESIFSGCTLHSGLFSLLDSKQKLIAFEI